MKQKIFFIFYILLLVNKAFGQIQPQINITFSKFLATYDFIQKLSDNYPDNKFKQIFKTSKYHQKHYTDLISQLDSLNLYHSYNFEGYPRNHTSLFFFFICSKKVNFVAIIPTSLIKIEVLLNKEVHCSTKKINAQVDKVFDVMLDINNKSTLENI